MTSAQRDALPRIAQAAVACERAGSAPAELLTAQCILESGWLNSTPGNNCFGIKEYKGCVGRQLLNTSEWFTDVECKAFLALGDSRTAVPIYSEVKRDGRQKYAVKDRFATFPSLAVCFEKRATLFWRGRYLKHMEAYVKSADAPAMKLEQLIRAIGPIYATAPGYADSVLRIVAMPEVVQAIESARAALGIASGLPT